MNKEKEMFRIFNKKKKQYLTYNKKTVWHSKSWLYSRIQFLNERGYTIDDYEVHIFTDYESFSAKDFISSLKLLEEARKEKARKIDEEHERNMLKCEYKRQLEYTKKLKEKLDNL